MSVFDFGVGYGHAPMQTRGIQPGQLVTGEGAASLAKANRVLWRGHVGARRSFLWPNPDTAPVAVITEPEISYPFVLVGGPADVTARIPWTVAHGCEKLLVRAIVATRSATAVGLSVRCNTGTLVEAASTVSTPYQLVQGWYGGHAPSTWVEDPPWNHAVVDFVTEPSLPVADRRIAISFDAALSPTGQSLDDATYPMTIERYIKLSCVLVKTLARDG